MATKSSQKIEDPQLLNLARVEQKLDILIALLLRQVTNNQLSEWQANEKRPFVELLLGMGLLNEEISKIVGMSYGTVANIKSKKNKKRK